MAEGSNGRSTDSQLQLVIEDLRVLRDALERPPDETTILQLTQVTAGYFVVNFDLLELACEAWKATSEEELRNMFERDRTLDYTASRHDFESIAMSHVRLGHDVLRQGRYTLIDYSGDNLHMLLRLIDYAKYLADSAGHTVRWHPVARMLVGGVDQVDELRARLLADDHAAGSAEP